MPRVSDQHRAARRRSVLEAAAECFLAEGYRGASMHQIIAATGLSAGALYGHFPGGKAELIAAVAGDALERVLALHEVRGGFAPDRWLAGVLEGLDAQPRLTRLLLITWGEAAADAEVQRLTATHLESQRALIEQLFADWAQQELGLSQEQARQWVVMFAQAVLSVLQGWVVQSVLLPGFRHEAYLDYARTIVNLD